ncbi:MAG TPA: GIY-YIG nuclease family protein [Candidatus Scybalousia intestinigallinarum]|nr:GIY-YIG nuclease family protein [Candidatus Scybalousia intestinigallinarum]
MSDIIGDSASLAAGVAIGGTSILAGVGIVALGYAALKAVSSVLVNLIQQTVSGAVSATKDMISNATKSSKKKNSPTERLHNVYVLRNQNTHQVEYVGRTTNVEKTEYRHKQNPFRADLKIDVVAYDIPYATARGLEQALIMQCRTLNPNKSYPRGNQINGVAPEKLKLYWDYAVSWLDNNIVSCN